MLERAMRDNIEKHFVLGIKRDEQLSYYVKVNPDGTSADIWSVPKADLAASQADPTGPKPTGSRVSFESFAVDNEKFMYHLDADGDVSRRPRKFPRR